MTEAGLMTPTGAAKIEAAKLDGSWDQSASADSLAMPRDLAAALRDTPNARQFFKRFPAGARTAVIAWIDSAKRAPTRSKRIAETARLAALNDHAALLKGRRPRNAKNG